MDKLYKSTPLFHIQPGGAYSDRTDAARRARIRAGDHVDSVRGLSRADFCAEELMGVRGSQVHCRRCGQTRCKMKKMINSRANWKGRTEALEGIKVDWGVEIALLILVITFLGFLLLGIVIDHNHPGENVIDYLLSMGVINYFP